MLNHCPPRRLAISLVAALSLGTAASRLAAAPPRLVADLAPGSTALSPDPHDFAGIGGVVVYVDRDLGEWVPALWRTDGTAAGTRRLAILVPTGGESRALGTAGGRAFFSSGSQVGGDLRLWATDGTWRGTVLLTPRPIAAQALWQASAGGEHLYLTTCAAGTGCSFWSSDGTPDGTASRGTLPVDGELPEPVGLVALDGLGLQLVRGASDTELVAVDPGAGIRPLARFAGPTTPRLLAAAGGRAFFLAPGDSQEQLWVSDGTAAGTRALTAFTNPSPFGRTFFLEPDGQHGREPWVWTPAGGDARRR